MLTLWYAKYTTTRRQNLQKMKTKNKIRNNYRQTSLHIHLALKFKRKKNKQRYGLYTQYLYKCRCD